MERMEEDLVGEKNNVRSVRLRVRSRMGWMDCLKRELSERGMSVEQGRMIVHDRSEWRAMVNA